MKFKSVKRGKVLKTNIILVGFGENVIKETAKRLAKFFELFFADAEALVEYHLTNSEENIENLCGIEYLNKLKNDIMVEISRYENAFVYIPLSIYASDSNCEILSQNGYVVFVNGKQKDVQNYITNKEKLTEQERKVLLLALQNRLDFCKNHCDLQIFDKCTDSSSLEKKIVSALKKYFSMNDKE